MIKNYRKIQKSLASTLSITFVVAAFAAEGGGTHGGGGSSRSLHSVIQKAKRDEEVRSKWAGSSHDFLQFVAHQQSQGKSILPNHAQIPTAELRRLIDRLCFREVGHPNPNTEITDETLLDPITGKEVAVLNFPSVSGQERLKINADRFLTEYDENIRNGNVALNLGLAGHEYLSLLAGMSPENKTLFEDTGYSRSSQFTPGIQAFYDEIMQKSPAIDSTLLWRLTPSSIQKENYYPGATLMELLKRAYYGEIYGCELRTYFYATNEGENTGVGARQKRFVCLALATRIKNPKQMTSYYEDQVEDGLELNAIQGLAQVIRYNNQMGQPQAPRGNPELQYLLESAQKAIQEDSKTDPKDVALARLIEKNLASEIANIPR